jgi:hypothetical protein
MSPETYLTCLSALPLVGETHVRKGEQLLCSCPACGKAMEIVQPSMLCTSRSCDFGRGGAIDYLAYVTGSYREALRLVGLSVPGLQLLDVGEAERLAHRRKLLAFFLDLESNSQNSDHERVFLRIAFRETGVSPHAFKAGTLYATGAEARKLQLLLLEYGVYPPSTLSDQPVILLPYWGYYHALCTLVVIPADLRSSAVVEIDPYRYSWFGLSQKRVTCQALDTFPTYLDTMSAEQHFLDNVPDRFPAHLLVDPSCDEPGFMPKDLVFHGFYDTWFENLPRWSLMDNFENCRFYEHDKGYMSLDALLEHLLIQSVDQNLSKFLDLCTAIRMPVASRSVLLLRADQLMDRDSVRYLRSVMSRRLLERDLKGSLYECAEGYELETGGSVKRLSNFTITLKSVVAFSALSALNYQGTCTVGPVVFDFDISSRMFDSPAKLADILHSTQLNRPGGYSNGEDLAVVESRQEFKRVLDWLRAQAARLPRSRGYQNLGWSRRHDLFITPLTVVDTVGTSHGVSYYAEELGDHHCFSSRMDPLEAPSGKVVLPVALAELVSGMVAQTVRYYHGLKVRPIPILNNHAGRELGKRLFRGFGQTSPLRLTNIFPRNLELNRGMPCLILGLNELQAPKVTIAGLYLSESGPDLAQFSEEDIDTAAVALTYLVTQISHRLMVGDPVSFREKRSVRPLNAVAVEGADMIRQDFWHSWPEAGYRHLTTDKIFEVHQDHPEDVFAVDEAKDEVLIRPLAWESVKAEASDLVIEFGIRGAKVTLHPEGIRVDRASFYMDSGEYYGEVPKLPVLAR